MKAMLSLMLAASCRDSRQLPIHASERTRNGGPSSWPFLPKRTKPRG